MEVLLKPPEHLRLNGDISENWRLFKQKFELFLTASAPAASKEAPTPGPTKLALLLSIAGDDALEVYNNFSFDQGEDRNDYATVIKKFDEYFAEQLNEVHERYVFRQRVQDEGEPTEHFLRDLRKLAQSCNFGTMTESMIRDQLVFGTKCDKVREKLLRDNKLTLATAEQLCKAAEVSAARNDMWTRERQVDPVKARPRGAEQPAEFKCQRCGRVHGPRKCPAFGRMCRKCGGKNHFAVRCKTAKQVAEVEDSDENFQILEVSVDAILQQKDWIVQAHVGHHILLLKVDTGAQACIKNCSSGRD